MGNDHDAEIARLENEIEGMRPELEAACDSFLDASASALAEFWPGFIDRCIRHAGDAVSKLGQDQLREVKAQVEEVQAGPRDVARDYLVDKRPRIWPHLATTDELVHAGSARGRGPFGWIGEASRTIGLPMPPEKLAEPMESAAGVVARPLRTAELPIPGNRWNDPTAPIEWTTAMTEAIQQYGRRATEALGKARELGQARAARERDVAASRWNEA
jgi:hypothetical protein